MFIALKEIRAARGRVALMSGVVGLITLLLIMLTGLTGGLSAQHISAMEALSPQTVGFSTPEPSFTQSEITVQDNAEGVPLGVAQTRLGEGDTAVSVAIFGLPEGAETPVGGIRPDQVLVSASAAEKADLREGDTVRLGGIDTQVGAIVPDLHYSHVPVVWGPTELWRQVTRAPQDAVGTVVLDDAAGVPLRQALSGLPAYSSERGSLLTMQALLYAISALVTIAFLSVWTIQRTRDLSILRALGASRSYLLRDSLAQAGLLLIIGAAAGAVAGAGLGTLAAQSVPFAMSAITVLVPAAGIWALGMAGAFLATRRVAAIDPLQALGGNA